MLGDQLAFERRRWWVDFRVCRPNFAFLFWDFGNALIRRFQVCFIVSTLDNVSY